MGKYALLRAEYGSIPRLRAPLATRACFWPSHRLILVFNENKLVYSRTQCTFEDREKIKFEIDFEVVKNLIRNRFEINIIELCILNLRFGIRRSISKDCNCTSFSGGATDLLA